MDFCSVCVLHMLDILEHAQSLADLIDDYRSDQIPKIDTDHVLRWAAQFDEKVRASLVSETTHILQSTYLSRQKATDFLSKVVKAPKLNGGDPLSFWKSANLMDIQLAGNSQSELLHLLVEVLRDEIGIEREDTGQGNDVFIYLDDGMFTGNRIRRDLEAWLTEAPDKAELHVILFVLHRGTYYARGELTKAIRASGKSITLKWWRMLELEDRKSETDASDVLRPVSLPADPLVEAHVANMKYKPHLRTAGSVGQAKLFSSDEARQLLESEFLLAGVRIRADSPYLGDSQRPLGHMSLETLGFGSMFVTYRNCPNNAPLAFWAGDPWTPLFPRTTNRETAIARHSRRGTRPWA